MILRGPTTDWRPAAAALLWLGLAAPALADAAPPPGARPPVCAGRDLAREVALHPDALALANEKRRDQLDNAQGLLWRIEKPGAAPSYLFGTIHSTDDRAIAIAKTAAAHIVGAKVVATELGGPFDKIALAEMGGTMIGKALSRDGDTLSGLGAPADVALVERYLAGRGLGADFAHHISLWFLAALTAAPPCEIQRQQGELPIVDEVIARTGKEFGVKVVGLETMEEQTEVLSSMDPSLAAIVLLDAVRRPGLTDDLYATLLSLYVQQEPGEILAVIDASRLFTPEETKAQDAFADHLLGARNKIMAERMKPLLDAGGAFVAVGALHLVGKGGLVALLRAEGFGVTAAR
jgi:uncharacterized protein YbaP (TraB family)